MVAARMHQPRRARESHAVLYSRKAMPPPDAAAAELRKRTRVDEPTDSAGLSEREAALLQQVAALRLQLDAQTAELSTLRALSSSPRLRDGLDGQRAIDLLDLNNGANAGTLPSCLAELAMDALSEGITIADLQQPDAPLIYANDGFCRMTGYRKDETVGHNCRFLQGPLTDSAKVNQLREAIAKRQPVVVELQNYRKDGTPFMNQLSLTPIHAEDGRTTHYVGIQCDVTQLHVHRDTEIAALKKAAEATAGTEAKSRFLAHMSHEIRTPLNGILAVGQMLEETVLSDEQKDLVGIIRMSGETLLTLICDILDFSRIEAQKLLLEELPFSLEETLERVLQICSTSAAKKRINVAYTVDRDVPLRLVGDAGRLQQVLLNSVVNSLKFTPRGGTVELRCSNGVNEQGQRMLTVEVKDNGIGISEEGLSKLFACFSQVDSMPSRKFDGAGLGLAISRRLCEAMGGTMTAQSAGLDKGSTFFMSVLLKQEPPPAPGVSVPVQPLSTFLDGRRLLVADTCEPVRIALLAWLTHSWGAAEVKGVADERELAEAMERGAGGQGLRWDAVLCNSSTPLLSVIKAHSLRAPALKPSHVFAFTWPVIPASTSVVGLVRPASFSAFEGKELTPFAGDAATTCPEEVMPGCISLPKPLRQSRVCNALASIFAPELLRMEEADKAEARVGRKALLATKASPSSGSLAIGPQPGEGESGLRVLLAEDHSINQKVVIGLLKRYKHRVTCVAHDGVDALEKLRLAEGPDAFDVILMDLHMPRMGGMECAKAISAEWPQSRTPIIAVTADAFEESRQRCLSQGFAGWLSKPFRVDGMLKVLAEVTSEQQQREQQERPTAMDADN